MKAMRVLLWACYAVFAYAQDKPPATCGDFLSQLQKKPKNLEFIECKPHPEEQTKPLVAKYRVKGIYAAGVERYLSRTFGMNRLINHCCLWEIGGQPGHAEFHKEDGQIYLLWMSSEETRHSTRDQWPKIHYFYVEVELETELP